jgi:CO/xanthine dehydrogenase Mo-binding subunit
MMQCADSFGWTEKYPVRRMPNGKIRAAGVAMAMQGSGISGVDVGSAAVKLNDDGFYVLRIGAADMGTGCDTILAQMTAECMDCSVDDVTVFGADSDASPYDSGSYASSTTYVTGRAVEKACMELKEKICAVAADMLDCPASEVVFNGREVTRADGKASVSLVDIATRSMCGNTVALEAVSSHSSPTSPPPFMAGMAEIELDPETGAVEVVEYHAAVDCGTTVNPNLARIQTEGGLVQAIGMTLTENIRYDENGRLSESSLMQYRIPTRLETGRLHVEFAPSYEQSGPFGAKSIGEIVINTPAPAIAHAIYRATGHWYRELPILPERIALDLAEEGR